MDKQLAFSTLQIKAVDNEKREFTGIASTAEPDRMQDIVVPEGAKFKLPLPFLWQHDHQKPIGEIYEAKVTSKGIEVKGRIKNVSAPSQLAARLDEAWVSLREGLVRGLSIGFRPIKYSFLDTGGMQFDEWDWMELSAVTIPANASGQVTSLKQIKSFDREIRAAIGNKADELVKQPSGVSEKSKQVKLETKEKQMSLSEKLKGFQDELKAKNAKLVELAEKSAEQGQTFDEADQEAFDTLESEVKSLKEHIARLETAQKAAIMTAKPVTQKDGEDEVKSAQIRSSVAIKKTEKLDQGVGFARFARIKALAFTGQAGTRDEAQIAKMLYPNDEDLMTSLVQKAAVPAANTLSTTWAGNLINEGGASFADFVEYLRPRTVYGQISSRFRRLPFDAPVLVQGSGGTAQWVKEGDAKPLTQWTYTRVKLTPLKVAAIAAATKETLMRASVAADTFMRDELARAVGERIDTTLISEDAAVSDESPAGLLNGTAALTLTGDGTTAGVRCDIAQFLKAMVTNNLSVAGAFWVMPETVAIALSLAENDLGGPAFPGVTPTGGTLAGLPVFTSQYMPVDSDGPVVALIKGDEIFLGDEGGIQVSVSDQATLQMDNAPTQSSIGTPTATSGVSMWQTNSVAFLVERFLNFQKRRASAVVWAHVDWDLCANS